jgi:3'-phosphoadenosine 5'-phosphosulfate sulfotransferase (PAPS reductase)/FAD synthetase
MGLDIVKRPKGDLLHQVEHERKMWPSPVNRYCTSDHKPDQVEKVITKRVNRYIDLNYMPKYETVKVLSCMGLRAQESSARSKKVPWGFNTRASNGKRDVFDWLPIHDWTEAQVWALIHEKGLPYHKAYDLGMPRLSCVFCIYAPPEALLLAGFHNPAKLKEYVRIEQAIGHAFQYDSATKQHMPLVNIQRQLEAGYVPQGVIDGAKWLECA